MPKKGPFAEWEREKIRWELNRKLQRESDQKTERVTGRLKQYLKEGAGKARNKTEQREERTGILPYTLASELIPLKKIENGILCTKDERYLKIVEILPVNFLMRSVREQQFVIRAFYQWLKVAPCRFQIRTIARRADIGSYLQ